MTPDQGILRLQTIKKERPDADDIVILEADRRKQFRNGEKDCVKSFRVGETVGNLWEQTLDRVSSHIGSKRREACLDYILAATNQALDAEIAE